MKDTLNKTIKIIAFSLCAFLVFSMISLFCERKTYEGAWNHMGKMEEFYRLEKNSLDYIAVGSSHLYCALNPLEVWNRSGFTGFVLATQRQPLLASYYYIKEAFKTQSPKYVVLEGYMITGEETYEPSVLHDALDPLKFSLNKFQMINRLVDYEQRPEYYFNLVKYHNRWSTLSANEINVGLDKTADIYKGYVAIRGNYQGRNRLPDYQATQTVPLSEFNTNILNDINELVTDHGARLILMIAPYEADQPEVCQKIKATLQWAQTNQIQTLDYCALLNELQILPDRDYYDAGHLDLSGAAKISLHFADFLAKNGLQKNPARASSSKWRHDYLFYAKKFEAERAPFLTQ